MKVLVGGLTLLLFIGPLYTFVGDWLISKKGTRRGTQ